MNQAIQDLRALSRAPTSATAPAAATTVPLPRSRWRTRVLIPAVLLVATLGLFGYAAGDALWPTTTVRVVPVVVKTGVTAQAAGTVVVQAPGWVEADPFPIAVSALADGVVQDVLVLEGQPVARDQVVVRLVPDDAKLALAAAQAARAERQSALDAARALRAEAESNWEHPIELTRARDTAAAQLEEKQAELERWPAELAREQAHAVYLQAEYDRVRPLHTDGQASDIELIQARQNYEAQQAQVEATQKREPILRAQIAELTAEVQAANENLRLRIADTRAVAEARAAEQRAAAALAAAQAAYDEAQLRMTRMEVRAPAAGLTMERLVEPGSKVMLGGDMARSAQVLRLYDPNHLQVRIDVPLVDAAKVGVGQAAEVVVDVLPDRTFRGHVTRIVHEADVQKNTLQVKVAIEHPSPELKPEMLARARFLAPATTSAPADTDADASGATLLIPRGAVHQHAGNSAVWLANQVTNRAEMRHVTLGAPVGDAVTVLAGLRPGDRVIIQPPPDLREGSRIRLIEAGTGAGAPSATQE